MTPAELRDRWQHRLDEFRRLGALVNGEAVAREILGDIEQLETDTGAELLTPAVAGRRIGYHPESICRLIRQGKLKNYGTKHRPLVKAGELPRKHNAPGDQPSRGGKVAGRIDRGASSLDGLAREALAGRMHR